MKKTLLSALIAATAIVPAVAQAELSANVAATSNYLWRGLEQGASGDAAVSGGIDYAAESGFYAGTWASNVRFVDDNNVTTTGYELDFYAGFSGSAGSFDYDVGFIYFAYDADADSDFSEIYGSVSLDALTLGVAVLATSEDNDFGDSIYVSADYAIEVGKGAELAFHVGNYSGDFAENDMGEGSTDLGVSLSKDGFTFGLSKVIQDGGDEDLKPYVSYAVDFEL